MVLGTEVGSCFLLLSAVRFPFKDVSALGSFWEKRLSPRRAPKRSLLPLSPKRTQVRLKSLLYLVWPTPDPLQTHGRPSGKSAVCGLNGHRSNFVIALSLGAYEHAI